LEEERKQVRDLSARLVALHAVLLGYERRAYEETHGPTRAADLLRLVVDHEQFAWLRSLSSLIARIDEALDADESAAEANLESFFREIYRLLRSDENAVFGEKYREALQKSPDAVMAHAEVMKILPHRPKSPGAEPRDFRR
jgi:hypothetical protein